MHAELDASGLDELLVEAARRGAEKALAGQAERRPWLNVDQAATHLATSPDAVRALVKRRQLPVHRTPVGRLLFNAEELDAWVRNAEAA